MVPSQDIKLILDEIVRLNLAPGTGPTCPVCGASATQGWRTSLTEPRTVRTYKACGHTIVWDKAQDAEDWVAEMGGVLEETPSYIRLTTIGEGGLHKSLELPDTPENLHRVVGLFREVR